jgi:outer membrane biosynthesis protein TonB
MIKYHALYFVPAVWAAFATLPAYAGGSIVSTPPSGSGSSIRAALEAAKDVPVRFPGRDVAAPMTGKVLVRFHVAADGHPEDIQIVKGATRGELNFQTKKSVARSYCPACAGQDYTATFDYRE